MKGLYGESRVLKQADINFDEKITDFAGEALSFIKPQVWTEWESCAILSYAGPDAKSRAPECTSDNHAEGHGEMVRMINSNLALINIPAGSSYALLLMKITTDKSIIMGHFWIGLDDRLLSGCGHNEKTTNLERWGQKWHLRTLARFHWLLCQHAISLWHRKGKVVQAGWPRGESE